MSIGVILADDHTIFRQGLTALLQGEPTIEVLGQAANGSEAWRLIASLQPAVAILDLGMPQDTGIEVARRVERACLDTRIVLLTGRDDPNAALEAAAAGVAGYVLKDSSFDELVLAVQTVTAGGTFTTPSLRTRLRTLQRNGRATGALSPREREVIRLIALGHTNKEIARILDISPRTVDTHRGRSMEKLGLHSLAAVVRYSVQTGMLE